VDKVRQTNQRHRTGKAIAAVLAGSWHTCAPAIDLTHLNLAGIIPLLIESGAGALTWWHIRHSELQRLPKSAIRELRQTYYYQAVYAARHEQDIVHVFAMMRAAGVEPILIKGWAIARLYPESGLRPVGDIDLYISPTDHATARAVLSRSDHGRYWVDLEHDQITRFREPPFEELYSRSRLVELNGAMIRVLSIEDHLRILCFHLLKHGAWRPLWLCDVAVALESRGADFDWNRSLGSDDRRSNWIVCTIQLAHQLLGANLENTPLAEKHLPGWLIPSVLDQWDAPLPPSLPLAASQIREHLLKPFELIKDFQKRWPNPIQATVDANGPFNGMPRLPLQAGNCCVRAVQLLRNTQGVARKRTR
jgi:hypothetical protein